MESINKEVRKCTARAIRRITDASNPAAQKAALANLRRGIGHEPGDLPQLWGEFLQDMPEELFGKKGQPSRAEWAVYTALTLFAAHQQGHDVNTDAMHKEGCRLGASAAQLATNEDERDRITRRLNALATANSAASLAQHLRGLVQLLRAQGIPLDYVDLAENIYRYQFSESVAQVRLAWGQDFYAGYYRNQSEEDKKQ